MTYEEELRDAGRYFADPAARADWLRDELKNSFSCRTCGSPDPAIIEGRYCCNCKGEDAAKFDELWLARHA